MSPQLALAVFVLFIGWLLFAERKLRARIPVVLWIPIVWIFLLGSRPASYWFGATQGEAHDDYLEGSPTDRLVFLSLIALGFLILWRRRVNWRAILQNNSWVLIYFLYLGLSTLWSDYPFVSFKRWIKDLGNVIMVVIILTERDPIEAVKAVFFRTICLLIPLSVLVIKYYPELGRYYDRWTGQAYYSGLTTNKNLLGMTLFVSGLFLLWRFIDRREPKKRTMHRADMAVHVALAMMTLWLLSIAHSSTAIACSLLGGSLLIGTKIPAIRKRFNHMGIYGLAALLLVTLLQTTIDLREVLVGTLDRDVTLTGRTDIWKAVLNEDINPLTGVGFYSFWLGERVDRLSKQYHYALNEAHNGYIETYLNSGLIGLFLLIMVLFSASKRIKRQVIQGSDWGGIRFALLLSIAIYNMTEATFNRLGLVWFVLLLVIVEHPPRVKALFTKISEPSSADSLDHHPAWKAN